MREKYYYTIIALMGAQHLQNRQKERAILLHDNSSYGCITSTEQAK
jgi:hypothetical protein